jgi:hypothetical protein
MSREEIKEIGGEGRHYIKEKQIQCFAMNSEG